ASSVEVVDVQKRRRLNEIGIPGGTSIYPTGARGFSSLCQDGTLASFTLGAKGQVRHESRSAMFNDIDHDVMYMEPGTAGHRGYVATEKGHIRPVDLGGSEPQIQAAWPLMTPEQWTDGWRTEENGGPLLAFDDEGRLYVRLYRQTGYDKQKRDNTEVWVY